MYGLLGKKLSHSFSKTIHEYFTEYDYSLIETECLESFFQKRDFKGINVTIPYKSAVIPFLDELSPEAEEIQAVNTVINERGKLIGYNTDYYGLRKALEYNNISVRGMNVIILGNGSTSSTILTYCNNNSAKSVQILARNPRENEHHFSSVDNFKNTNIIFNATPVGMFPDNDATPIIDVTKFANLISVVDMIYNPLRSNLIINAQSANIKTVNGLFMLISQAVKSIELFHNIHITDETINKYYKDLLFKSMNIVFVGMPMSGKSFFSKIASDIYNKDLVDIDSEIEINYDKSIVEIFKTKGERTFRKLETREISKYSKMNNQAISCGGGAILNMNNIRLLKQNGIIIFIDVDLALLKKCNPKNRPLLRNRANLEKLYNTRYPLYRDNADIIIKKTGFNEKETLKELEVKLNEYLNS